jgi:hypothetical protein
MTDDFREILEILVFTLLLNYFEAPLLLEYEECSGCLSASASTRMWSLRSFRSEY